MSIKKTLPRQARRTFAGAAIGLGVLLGPAQDVPAQDAAKVVAGEAVYNDYCFTCHGEKLVSSGQTFDLRRLTAADRVRFENAVQMGKNQMPPWKGVLTTEQIDQLWHFIRAYANQN